MRRLLILSDTHISNGIEEFPDLVVKQAHQADIIIHAGDFISPAFYEDLKQISDLKAVLGNMDQREVREQLSEKNVFEIENYKIGVIHGHQLGRKPLNRLGYVFPECDIIIFGHSHNPYNKNIEGKIFFNPGSATDKRLQEKYSYGIITLEEEIKSKIYRF